MKMKDELTEPERYWLDHLKACEQSSRSTKEYGKAHGLSVSMLYTKRSAFVRQGLLPTQTPSTPPTRFDRVSVSGTDPVFGEWRITLPNGVGIGFSGAVDAATLATVLGIGSRI